MRAIFETLGAEVDWDGDTRTATGTLGEHTVVIQVGETEAQVDGETRTLDVPAQIIQNRTMVPARFISEAFGCSVTWDGTSQTAAVANRLNGEHIYITPTGKRYHFDEHCHGPRPHALSKMREIISIQKNAPNQDDLARFCAYYV